MAAQTLRELEVGFPARSLAPARRIEPHSRVRSVAFHARRWARLIGGLWVFAAGIALMVKARLGLSSWDVLHDALRQNTSLSFGAAVIFVSVVVLLGSFLMGVKPGPGTIANTILVGAFTNALLGTGLLHGLPSAHLLARAVALAAGIGAIAAGTALYISAGLGAGPRDSLMLAAAKQLRVSPGNARVLIEGSVLLIGALMGGTVGVGTVFFAIARARDQSLVPPIRCAIASGKTSTVCSPVGDLGCIPLVSKGPAAIRFFDRPVPRHRRPNLISRK